MPTDVPVPKYSFVPAASRLVPPTCVNIKEPAHPTRPDHPGMHVSIRRPHMPGCEVTFPTPSFHHPLSKSPVPFRCLEWDCPPSRRFASSCRPTREKPPTHENRLPHRTELLLTEAATFRPPAACLLSEHLVPIHTSIGSMEKLNGLTKGPAPARLGNGKAMLPSRKYGAPGAKSLHSRLFNTAAR